MRNKIRLVVLITALISSIVALLVSLATLRNTYGETMKKSLAQTGLNDSAVRIVLGHAKIESGYHDKVGLKSVQGVARKNKWNLWNVTSRTGRVRKERENGRLIKKRWHVWKTSDEAAREFVSYMRRKHRGALTAASRGDTKSYVKILKKNKYFTGSEKKYLNNLKVVLRNT